MRVVVIPGSGHIGTFLVPRLVRAGHEVVNISRGQRAPMPNRPKWRGEPQAPPRVELMHHPHADDVAQAFERAVAERDTAGAEDFDVVAPTALTVRGFAHEAARWFGQVASLESVSWEEFRGTPVVV